MSFASSSVSGPPPKRIRDLDLPDRPDGYFPSARDWREEVLYFLLPDRFSDGKEATRPLLDRSNLPAARPALPGGTPWRWDRWAESGAHRWQGGTIQGVHSKLPYLEKLGITAIWLGPVFKQRGTLNTFHGYGIANFLEVDPRFGTRKDLVDLVAAAHARGIRIILDIIFNHSGRNFDYDLDGGVVEQPIFRPWPGFYPNIKWLGPGETPLSGAPTGDEDGVWPQELAAAECYTRAGVGSLGDGDIAHSQAEHKRTDFFALRDFNFDPPGEGVPNPQTLNLLADCYKYWIALTDCDGFRIDTVKHVSFEQARNFCGAIKEFAATLGKHDFFLVGEVAGGDFNQDRYLDVLGQNLNAALDIGGMRTTLTDVAKGLVPPEAFFSGFDAGNAEMGSHRNLGNHHVAILDDHDHVFGTKIRFSSESASQHQVVAGVALQLFSLGIPCIYYGTEQALGGPEVGERGFLPGWKGGDHADRYLRETMFGALHPRQESSKGLPAQLTEHDKKLPGFGPFGTAGAHCFDDSSAVFKRISALASLRKIYPALRTGRQYQRPISIFEGPFVLPGAGELIGWSRILDRREVLCVVNGHGNAARGGDVLVDSSLTPPGRKFTVVANTMQAAAGPTFTGSHAVGSELTVKERGGNAFVELRSIGPSEVVILTNRP